MPNEEAREAFPKILTYYMNRDNISQSDISARLNVSKQIVSDWVSGKKFPRVDKMQRLADMFGVLLSDMYTYSKFPSSGSIPAMHESSFPSLTDEEQLLILAWRKSDEVIKAGVRKLLDIPDDSKSTESSAI